MDQVWVPPTQLRRKGPTTSLGPSRSTTTNSIRIPLLLLVVTVVAVPTSLVCGSNSSTSSTARLVTGVTLVEFATSVKAFPFRTSAARPQRKAARLRMIPASQTRSVSRSTVRRPRLSSVESKTVSKATSFWAPTRSSSPSTSRGPSVVTTWGVRCKGYFCLAHYGGSTPRCGVK
ncbi:hypothetical protein IWX90DRAFT_183442 [Phyllosticta citrichinensis]|uniref:Uncharacterized protein n=1 Tax=Phyllosticta citrichinensis TaxID=1130410 RepID=A0ABR1XW02_9PEZI